jgi:DNA-binding NtrC family response regulator
MSMRGAGTEALAWVPARHARGEPEESTASQVRGAVLVVDDDALVRAVLEETLRDEGYAVETVGDGQAALEILASRDVDIVLLDLNMPKVSGLNVLSALPSLHTDAQIIVLTAFGTVESAVDAMKAGAYDFLKKPWQEAALLHVVDRAMKDLRTRRELARVRNRARDGGLADIIGRSLPMERVFRLVERVAPTRATVLVTGETGTGKELVARAIHDLSPRADKPFVAVNCSALPETLLEAELFGHARGSFTGAVQSRRGLIEEASGGTLFLDEISTLSEDIQVKLLRVLEDRRVQRIGSNNPVSVDFRLIAATNRDLARLVADGQFREDLYFRLDVFPIVVPPLRERRDDIPLLASHFLARYAEEHGLEPPRLRPGTLARMSAYDWPGNVRELENLVERTVVMAKASTVGVQELPRAIRLSVLPKTPEEKRAARDTVVSHAAVDGDIPPPGSSRADHLRAMEKEELRRALEATGWVIARAAKILGWTPRQVAYKMKKHSLKSPWK